jgi:AmmeMemoRadiSam system protein B/AmmeMemoRadiSam system protein A
MTTRPGFIARLGVLALVCGVLCCGATGAGHAREQDREPIGPGQFYPGSAVTLKAALQALLADAVVAHTERPVAIVVPHAGYVYSGQIAADAYRQAAAPRYDTVVVLGTNHTDGAFRQVAIQPGGAYRTPLGAAVIDEAFVAALRKEDPDCVLDAGPHRKEHSVEVQVPFVQQLFPAAKIVPLVVGQPDRALCTRLGRALAALARDRQVLLVASSDLSHYPSADDATRVDRRTIETIAGLDVEAFYGNEFGPAAPVRELVTHACGSGPIMAVMTAAKSLGAVHATAVSYANSGDTSLGDTSRTVGYGAVVFTVGERGSDLAALKPPSPDGAALDAQDKKMLLAFARETIRRFLVTETVPLARGFSPRAYRNRGVFVTLKKHGELRGCIGHIPSDASMPRLVGAMALQSAFNDPRFEKLRPSELKDIEIEISILSPPKTVGGPSDIVIGRDGVFINADGSGAVFLPQVAPEQGWNRDQMLDNLCLKAGLPANRWRRGGVTYATFQADVFGEGQR